MLIKDALPKLGDDVVMISIDGDGNENADLLKRYADQYGFDWRFAVAPREVLGSLADEYGSQWLYPPSESMIVVSPDGDVEMLGPGRKQEADLVEAVQRAKS